MKKINLFLLSTSFIFSINCAQVNPLLGKESLIWDANAYPTMANISQWMPLWDGHGWLVGISDPAVGLAPQGLGGKLIENQLKQWLSSQLGPMDITIEPLVSKPFSTPPSPLNPLMPKHHTLFPEEAMPQGVSLAFISFPKATPFLRQGSSLLPHWGAPPLDFGLPHHKAAWYQHKVLGALPQVLWAEPNLKSQLLILPDLRKFNTDAVRVLNRIKVLDAYTTAAGRKLSPVNIAVLDTGVDPLHPQLKNRMWVNPHLQVNPAGGPPLGDSGTGYKGDLYGIDATLSPGETDPQPEPRPGSADLGGPGAPCPQSQSNDALSGNCGHGTHVAGIIAGEPSPVGDVAGVCPTCRIISLRVSERIVRPAGSFGSSQAYEVDGGISDVAQVRALNYLLDLRQPNNPDALIVNVVNMSLGKYFRSRSMYTMVRNLLGRNVIIVAAAGNDNTETPSYPAAYGGVVAVCALGEDISKLKRGIFGKAVFSNFGDWVDICAPGTEILSTVPGTLPGGVGMNDRKSGTSQAAPYVAGVMGFMLSYFGNTFTSKELIERVKTAANSIIYAAASNLNAYEATFKDGTKVYLLGTGIVDLNAALLGQRQNNQSNDNLVGPSRGCVVQSIGATTPSSGDLGQWAVLFPGVVIWKRRWGKIKRKNGID